MHHFVIDSAASAKRGPCDFFSISLIGFVELLLDVARRHNGMIAREENELRAKNMWKTLPVNLLLITSLTMIKNAIKEHTS